ncbi:acyltransferase [Chryseobacterium daeguense]|uniref:acyltransferase n=1 Tax=Chryseobacterium daeguense TaxID=412438 RepID=UPI00040CE7E1|nr:acyltransferase [Chryseobacterium daeguense]
MIISKIYNKLLNIFLSSYYKNIKNINFLGTVHFKGVPVIFKHQDARITIGKNTLINSSKKKYHINMFSSCKLLADRPQAEIIIGENCRIHGTCIHAVKRIEIGNNCLIAANTNIIDSNGHILAMENPVERLTVADEGREVIIEDNVWIGSNVTVLGGSVIREGAVIMAGSVVKGEVPAKSIYGTDAYKVIKQY